MAPPDLGKKPSKLGLPASLLIDTVVLAFRAVAPLSAVALLIELLIRLKSKRRRFAVPTNWFHRARILWILSETAFLIYCKGMLLPSFQKQAPAEKVARITADERRALFLRCLETFPSPEAFIESWFITNTSYHELTKENVREFIAWGMFHRHDYKREMPPEESEQMEDFVSMFCSRCTQPVKEQGYNQEATLMKFTSEPVTHIHRPFALYLFIHHIVQEIVTPIRLGFKFGFHRKHARGLVYYMLRGSNSALPPLVFVHGIGVGLLPYESVVGDLVTRTRDPKSHLFGRSIMLIELHATSQRIAPSDLLRDDFVDSVKGIFEGEHVTSAMFLGHSYGSFAVGWVCQRAPHIVAGVGLLDPVCVCLHHPKAMYSILYSEPTNAMERALHFVIRGEMNWNFHVRRHFFWYANVLFLESLSRTIPALVVLSSDDGIVPVLQGKSYVEQYVEKHRDIHDVNLVYLEDCEHGGFLFDSKSRMRVLDGVEWIAKSTLLVKL